MKDEGYLERGVVYVQRRGWTVYPAQSMAPPTPPKAAERVTPERERVTRSLSISWELKSRK